MPYTFTDEKGKEILKITNEGINTAEEALGAIRSIPGFAEKARKALIRNVRFASQEDKQVYKDLYQIVIGSQEPVDFLEKYPNFKTPAAEAAPAAEAQPEAQPEAPAAAAPVEDPKIYRAENGDLYFVYPDGKMSYQDKSKGSFFEDINEESRRETLALIEKENLQPINLPSAPAADPAAEAADPAAATPEGPSADRKALARSIKRGTYERGQKADIRRSLGPMALVGGIGSAIQLLSAFRPDIVGTAQDKYVAEQMKSMEAKGIAPGLSGEERRMMERQLLEPARAFATESRQRREAQEAASGQRLSASALERSRQAEQQQMGEIAQKAGMAISQANLDAAAKQLQRYEQMKAYEGQRQSQKIGAAGQTVQEVAAMAGQMRAGKAARIMDPTLLVRSLPEDMSDAEAREIVGKVEKASRFGRKPGSERFEGILSDAGITAEEIGQDRYDSLVDFYTSDNLRTLRKKRQSGDAEDLYQRMESTPYDI